MYQYQLIRDAHLVKIGKADEDKITIDELDLLRQQVEENERERLNSGF
jgi:hypothetical protein